MKSGRHSCCPILVKLAKKVLFPRLRAVWKILGSARAFACWRLCPAIANFSLLGGVGFKVAHLPFRWRLGTRAAPSH